VTTQHDHPAGEAGQRPHRTSQVTGSFGSVIASESTGLANAMPCFAEQCITDLDNLDGRAVPGLINSGDQSRHR
jgi:hypothetical protein